MTTATKMKIPPQHTWLVIFLPAFLYYILLSNKNSSSSGSSSSSSSILSHLGLFPNHFTSVSTYLDVISSASSPLSNSHLLDSIFIPSASSSSTSSSSIPLNNFEYIIQNKKEDDGDDDNYNTKAVVNKNVLVDTVWMEDIELGRGFLLISDSYNHGTMWRYEIGGGPIPIGKSLFMDYSGCRSDLWKKCSIEESTKVGASTTDSDDGGNEIYHGSSGVTIQVTKDEETFLTGQLIIVEKGERRIIRLEKDGSRTPLVLNVTTSLCNDNSSDSINGSNSLLPPSHRILNPSMVYYTPFGDLLFTDHNVNGCNNNVNDNQQALSSPPIAGVYRLKEVVNVPPLSFQLSKDAHGWTEDDLQKYWVDHGFITDIASSSTSSSLSTNTAMELLYSNNFEHISGMVVGKDLTSLYIAGRVTVSKGDVGVGGNESRNVKYVIVKVPIDDDEANPEEDGNDDDDDSGEENDDGSHAHNDVVNQSKINDHRIEKPKSRGTRKEGLLDEKSTLFVDMTKLFESSNFCLSKSGDINAGISLAIDENGLIYATYPNGIAIINNSDGSLIATLTLKDDGNDRVTNDGDDNVCNSDFNSNSIIPNSITIGKDQYIYVTTGEGLMRIKTKTKPLEYPTNLIVPSKKIK